MDLRTQGMLRAFFWEAVRVRNLMFDSPTVRSLDGERYITGCSPVTLERGVDLGRFLDRFARAIGPKRWAVLDHWFRVGQAGLSRGGETTNLFVDLRQLEMAVSRSGYESLLEDRNHVPSE